MKPRNKFEKAVMALSTRLCPITKAQHQWAFRECIDHFAYRLPKGCTTCMACDHSWTLERPIDTCTCPQCRASTSQDNKSAEVTTEAVLHAPNHLWGGVSSVANVSPCCRYGERVQSKDFGH